MKFVLDDSSLVKLKGYKLISKDSGKSNIMKILFPRKQFVEKLAMDMKKAETTTDEQILSTIRNSDPKELEKHFVQVDNILVVSDPMDVNLETNNDLTEDDDVTTLTTDSNNMDTTEKPLKDLTLAERLKIAAKRRMLNKMTKLEKSLHRELFKRENDQDVLKTIEKSTEEVETATDSVTETVEKRDHVEVASETEAPKLSAEEGEIISATLGIRTDGSEIVTESVQEANEKTEETESASETLKSGTNEGKIERKKMFLHIIMCFLFLIQT